MTAAARAVSGGLGELLATLLTTIEVRGVASRRQSPSNAFTSASARFSFSSVFCSEPMRLPLGDFGDASGEPGFFGDGSSPSGETGRAGAARSGFDDRKARNCSSRLCIFCAAVVALPLLLENETVLD
jgi:hypothetical protein